MHSNVEYKDQLPEHFAAKLPRLGTKKYAENIKELLHESDILSSVDHPNIIKVHGISSTEASQSGPDQSLQPFFIILDRISYTLEDLLRIWASKIT